MGKAQPVKFYKIEMAIVKVKPEKKQSKTEWDSYYSSQTGVRPQNKRFTYNRRTLIFKCPHCHMRRQLIEQENLICGAVNCKCGSKFRVVRDQEFCISCRHKMTCLAEGLVSVKQEKDASPLYDSLPGLE